MSREDTAKEEGMMKARDLRQRNIPEETEKSMIKCPNGGLGLMQEKGHPSFKECRKRETLHKVLLKLAK